MVRFSDVYPCALQKRERLSKIFAVLHAELKVHLSSCFFFGVVKVYLSFAAKNVVIVSFFTSASIVSQHFTRLPSCSTLSR